MSDKAQVEELKHRVSAKKHDLQAKLEKMKADSARNTEQAQRSIRNKLDELDQTLSQGWENVKSSTIDRLNKWLDSSD